MLSARTIDPDTGTGAQRYRVAVWTVGAVEPVICSADTPGEAARAVLWARGDPNVCRIVTTDDLTGRQMSVWTR